VTPLIVGLIVTLALLAAGYGVGRLNEHRHVRKLDQEEREVADVLLTDLRTAPPGFDVAEAHLVSGEVVIATDYWKTFAAAIRNLFGGEVRSLGTLMSRARREARLRIVRQARELGATAVINVRIQRSEIGGQTPITEVYAYGTALVPRR
jgi:uncharacterized protein YbjQ (UPF0145 family)